MSVPPPGVTLKALPKHSQMFPRRQIALQLRIIASDSEQIGFFWYSPYST